MRVPRIVSLLLAVLAVAVVALPASGSLAASSKSKRTFASSKYLWSTVNVCDTARHPNRIGVRGSMPGSGKHGERMQMRIGVQYYSRSARRWRSFSKPLRSRWIDVGSARYRSRQSGATFRFKRPAKGHEYRLRGKVQFRWKRLGKVVRRATRTTTSHHRGTAGADPKRFSAARCTIS